MNHQIVNSLLTIVIVAAIATLLHHLTLFKERTIDEVIGYLRRIDWDELRMLFDPEEEEKLQGFWLPRNFRRTQRARLDQAREFLRCMYHNCLLLFQWSSTERKDKRKHHLQYDPELTASISNLISVTRWFCWIAFVIRCKIICLSLLNFDKLSFLPIPSVVALRTVRNTDLIELYEAAKKAAEALASVYGEESVQHIMGTM